MTLAFINWVGRLLSAAAIPILDARRHDRQPMKIEVERLPDYLWRELGFPQPRRSGEDR